MYIAPNGGCFILKINWRFCIIERHRGQLDDLEIRRRSENVTKFDGTCFVHFFAIDECYFTRTETTVLNNICLPRRFSRTNRFLRIIGRTHASSLSKMFPNDCWADTDTYRTYVVDDEEDPFRCVWLVVVSLVTSRESIEARNHYRFIILFCRILFLNVSAGRSSSTCYGRRIEAQRWRKQENRPIVSAGARKSYEYRLFSTIIFGRRSCTTPSIRNARKMRACMVRGINYPREGRFCFSQYFRNCWREIKNERGGAVCYNTVDGWSE